MIRAADQRRYRAAMLEALDGRDEADFAKQAADQRSIDLMMELQVRYRHARAAFPGMTWKEFLSLSQSRARDGQRGRRKQSLEERASTPIARAARDVDRLTAMWAASGDNGDPPVPHIELAAARHGVAEEELGERVRRPNSRNPHRQTEGD